MDIILDNIKLVLFVVIGGFWILGKIVEAKKAAQEQQREQEQEPWQADEDYENWEPEPAPGAQPPPIPPVRAGTPPALPRFVAASEEELQRQRLMQEKLAAIRSERRPGPTPANTSGKKPAAPTALVSPSLKARLRDRKELRRAFVMREILDPPVGLR